MKNIFFILLMSILSMNFTFPTTATAETDNTEETIEKLKLNITYWALEKAIKMTESVEHNIILEQLEIVCKSQGDNSWSCSVSPLIGKGSHANYIIKIADPGSDSRGFRTIWQLLRMPYSMESKF